MASLIYSRRTFLTASAAGASSLLLAGCDQFDFLGQTGQPIRSVLERANSLTYAAQRLIAGQQALARTYSASEIQQPQRPNGSTDPQTADYLALKANNFADYRLMVTGLVEKPLSFSLDELRNMPAQSQITRHDCVEGWSCISKWTGTRLGPLLDQAKPTAAARFCVYHCYDDMGGSLAGPNYYYESSDLVDAYHPQTLLAYGLDDQTLPVANGAPVRIRIERALGYKQPKFVHTIELVDSFAPFSGGRGGYWEDNGYDWYGGI
ncbi:MAG TPA: molybdopterin-dependent oxidoreductase [Devosia sp.]|jgi:DMSO/TMAO reductase YedYZ molybdopterin-dependent catalytic subunit|nr:molybdopterin-dependent oxidoreductase [Devosia sp.]